MADELTRVHKWASVREEVWIMYCMLANKQTNSLKRSSLAPIGSTCEWRWPIVRQSSLFRLEFSHRKGMDGTIGHKGKVSRTDRSFGHRMKMNWHKQEISHYQIHFSEKTPLKLSPLTNLLGEKTRQSGLMQQLLIFSISLCPFMTRPGAIQWMFHVRACDFKFQSQRYTHCIQFQVGQMWLECQIRWGGDWAFWNAKYLSFWGHSWAKTKLRLTCGE